MNQYRDIQAYRVAPLLYPSDLLFIFPYLHSLRRRTAESLRLELGGGDTPWQTEEAKQQIKNDIRHGATFLTNHRDIIMDAAWLSYLLRLRFNIRPYLGIGNNLLSRRWIEFLVRFNRCFVVIRDGSPKEVLAHAQHLSAYIQELRKKGKSIWLAQREGRAKDCNDRTQPAVLKMLTIGQDNFLDSVYRLNICPVSLSYEYDPCDFLKAKEMQQKRDDEHWKKSKEDDLVSMKTGMLGKKGRVLFRLTPSLNHWIDAHREELEKMTRNEQIQAVAKHIDYQIHIGYEIYERGEDMKAYLKNQLRKIELPHKDEAFLMERMREMYRNIETNHQQALHTTEDKI